MDVVAKLVCLVANHLESRGNKLQIRFICDAALSYVIYCNYFPYEIHDDFDTHYVSIESLQRRIIVYVASQTTYPQYIRFSVQILNSIPLRDRCLTEAAAVDSV